MKTRNLLLIGAAGLVAAYVIYMRKRPSGSASVQSDDVPVDSIDANEPKASAARASKKTSGLTLGQIGSRQANAPTSLKGYNQVFKNRVYTKVKDFYGEDSNIGLYTEEKRLALFQRIWMKLSEKGFTNPNMVALGEIGPAIKEVAQEGFDFRD